MLLRYFYDDRLAQASYLVGCVQTGEALVIDPARAIAPYVAAAAREGLRIVGVTETHIHADFVSGSRELAAATGATLYLSDMGDAGWKYAFAADANLTLLRDGDAWMVGNVRIEARHTPGHTPEHLAFLLTDTAAAAPGAAPYPMGLFTGDFIFAGDVGRPDLLEEAAGYAGTKEPGARAQFASIQRVQVLPDYLQVWPGHGAGSACGKALGAVPSTTLGYERLVNPAFQFHREADFVRWLLDGQPEPPRYFAQMKRVNQQGPALLHTLAAPRVAGRAALDAWLGAGGQLFDLRPRQAFAAAHVPGTISIPADETNYTTYVGWLVDYSRPLALVLPALDQLGAILADLRAIGVDDVAEVYAPEVVAAGAAQALAQVDAAALAPRVAQHDVLVLDVRGRSEYVAQHSAGARHIPVGQLPARLGELPAGVPLVTQCASGYRAQIAASILQAAGFEQVQVLNERSAVWARLLPTVQGAPVVGEAV